MKKIIFLFALIVLAVPCVKAQTADDTFSALTDWTVSQKTKNAFFVAVTRNKLDAARQLTDHVLVASVLVNTKDAKGNTPLMVAAERGHIEMALFLLENGAYLNATNDENMTALCLAAKHSRAEIVKALPVSAEQANYLCGKDKNKRTALFIAAENGSQPQTIQALVDKKADVNFVMKDTAITPLMKVAETDQIESARILLNAKADINARTIGPVNRGMTPAWFAIFARRVPMVKFLMDNGGTADPFYGDRLYVIALEVVRANGDTELANYLKSKGHIEPGPSSFLGY